METLAILVEAYEKDAHPIPPPHPIDAMRFAMEQQGLEPKDPTIAIREYAIGRNSSYEEAIHLAEIQTARAGLLEGR